MDEITATLESDQVKASLQRLGETTMLRAKTAAKETADAVQLEARSRLRRQLLRPTGVAEAGIIVEDALHFGLMEVGWIVKSVYHDERFMYNVPIWIERGTKRGKPGSHDSAPRPYFWPSVKLEIANHERRIAEAMDESIQAEGLGD